MSRHGSSSSRYDDEADMEEIDTEQHYEMDAHTTRHGHHGHGHSYGGSASGRSGSGSARASLQSGPGATAATSRSRPSSSSGSGGSSSGSRRVGTPMHGPSASVSLPAHSGGTALSANSRHQRGLSMQESGSGGGGGGGSNSGGGGGGGGNNEMHKNFKVVVRIRPPLPRELEGLRAGGAAALAPAYRDVVRAEDRNRAVTICESGVGQGGGGQNVLNADGSMTQLSSASSGGVGGAASHKFTFDYVYDQDAQQVDVYNNTARDAVLSTLQGYNATILAYGQTGTGKTFTTEGFMDDPDMRGIIPRSVEEIFNYIQNTANTNVRFLVRASYLQIYNEVISDLLKPERSNLSIREDKKRGVFVEGLSEWVVRSPREVYGLIKRGTALRATGSTRINETSSRSHALFIIIVEQNEMIYEEDPAATAAAAAPGANEQEKARAAAGTGTLVRQSFKVGKLNLVDLAGSERVRISGAKGRRLEESKYINQSLSALGNVISALTEGARSHIPYRDSKLTRILEDSFGGNVRATLLAMISPAAEAFLESLSTLKFASRAKAIRNEARINEDLDEKALLRRYERELKKLRQELQAKSKNVVDKRRLIEVEEQRRRAEQDKMAALLDMERLSRDLLTEKSQKKKLEERIKEMNSQLLVGGHLTGGAGGGADGGAGGLGGPGSPDSPHSASAFAESQKAAFQQALQLEQERIREQYSAKLAELEREREQMEEEKAQTSRYKQLLLKQRDIMIQLTARLNERDQSILLLQEELDAYDKHQRAMEDELDQKRHRLIQLQRMNAGAGGSGAGAGAGGGGIGSGELISSPLSDSSPTNSGGGGGAGGGLYGLFPIDEAPYFEENSSSPSASGGHSPAASTSSPHAHALPTPASATSSASAASTGAGGSASTSGSRSSSPPASSPSHGHMLMDPSLLEQEVSRRVAAALATRSSLRDDALQAQLDQLSDALERKTSETMRLRDELERAHADAAKATSAPGGAHAAHEAAVVASMGAALQVKEDALASLQAQNAQLVQNVTALQMRVQSSQSQLAQAQAQAAAVAAAGPTAAAAGSGGGSGGGVGSGADAAENRVLKDSLSSLKRKYDVQLQERAALKVILEKKMKALIDSIAAAALHGKGAGAPTSAAPQPGASPTGSPTPSPAAASKDVLPARTRREIEVLQRLVEASLTALKNSDSGNESASTPPTSMQQPQQPQQPQQQPPHPQQSPQARPQASQPSLPSDRDIAAGPSRLAPVFAASPSPSPPLSSHPHPHGHAHPLAASAPRSLAYGGGGASAVHHPHMHSPAMGPYAPSASPPPASSAPGHQQAYAPHQQHQQAHTHHPHHPPHHGHGHHALAPMQMPIQMPMHTHPHLQQQQQQQQGAPPASQLHPARPSPLSSPHLSSSLPRASSSSLSGDAAHSIDGIERLIAQRKEELQRLDQRLR